MILHIVAFCLLTRLSIWVLLGEFGKLIEQLAIFLRVTLDRQCCVHIYSVLPSAHSPPLFATAQPQNQLLASVEESTLAVMPTEPANTEHSTKSMPAARHFLPEQSWPSMKDFPLGNIVSICSTNQAEKSE